MISEHASPLTLLGGEDAGGQNVYVDELARHLAEQGHEVDVFTRWDNPMLMPVVELYKGVRVINLEAGPMAPLPKDELFHVMDEFRDSFYHFIEEEGISYDIIHANFWMSGWVACEARRDLGVPFVQTFHALGKVKRAEQGVADTSPEERFAVEERIANEADRILATCPAEAEDLITLYNADPTRITLVPCGVNLRVFRSVGRAKARAQLQLDNLPTVVYVGRLVKRKGIDNLIRAFTLLPASLGARLVIVGGEHEEISAENSPEVARLSAMAKKLGVLDRVTFVGKRQQDQLYRYYSAADVAVSTPWYEPFGMTPLEAMACGTPFIGSAVGGLRTTITDGVTGYLVPPHDPAILADRIKRILENPKLRDWMGRAARQRVEKLYRWSHVAARASGVFLEVLAEKDLELRS